jgi:hypothetical protein
VAGPAAKGIRWTSSDGRELARELLSRGIEPPDLELTPEAALLPAELARTRLDIAFPAGLAPIPQPIDPVLAENLFRAG